MKAEVVSENERDIYFSHTHTHTHTHTTHTTKQDSLSSCGVKRWD